MYYAEIVGTNWPETKELSARELRGRRRIGARERLERIRTTRAPEYFIVTDRDQYFRQKDLKQLLTDRFQPLAATEDYIIFDMRTH